MWPVFNKRAQRAIVLASTEAKKNQRETDADYMFLGLVMTDNSIATSLLEDLGIDIVQSRAEVEASLSQKTENGVSDHRQLDEEHKLSQDAKRIINQAWREAQQSGSRYVGTEHLLLGILLSGQSNASRALLQAGVDARLVRDRLQTIEGPRTAEGSIETDEEWQKLEEVLST